MTPIETLAQRALQVRASSGEVVSPCVSVCRIGVVVPLCEGCLRTLPEIAAWSRMPDAEKRIVWQRIELRLSEALA